MGLIDRYVARHFLGAWTATLFLLIALFSFVTLVDELDNVGQGAFTTGDALDIVALTMPQRILSLLPVTTLLGAVIGLGTMAGNREIVVLRASGWSPWRIARAILMVVAALLAVGWLVQNFAIPPMEKRAADIRSRSLTDSAVGVAQSEFWTKSGNHYVRVGDVEFGRIPQDIEVYEIAPDGSVASVLQASHADILDNNLWLLHDVHESRIHDDKVENTRHATLEWQSFLSERQMSAFLVPPQTLSSSALFRYIRQLEASGLSTLRYRVIFWQQMSLPVSILAMALLGVPFVMGSVRRFSAGYRITVGASIGIVFYLANQIAGNATLIYELDPAPVALGPSIVIFVVSVISLTLLSPPFRRVRRRSSATSDALPRRSTTST